jgi:hypothetical protein
LGENVAKRNNQIGRKGKMSTIQTKSNANIKKIFYEIINPCDFHLILIKMEERTKDKKVVGIFLLHYWGHSIPLLRIAEHLHQNCEDMEIIVYGSETLKGKIEELFSCLRVEYIEDGIYQGIFSQ